MCVGAGFVILKERSFFIVVMEKNIGTLDKVIRGILGLALIFVAANNYVGSDIFSVIIFILGLIFIFGSMFGFCFIYKIFGINTNRSKDRQDTPTTI
jgi:hypothetical protein